MGSPITLKEQLRAALTASMKARDALTTGTLRMALAAITTEEVSGAAARTLTDDEVRVVLTREVRKRKEAADAFAGAGRTELADRERAESAILTDYLPRQLDDEGLAAVVAQAVAAVQDRTGAPPGRAQMGAVIKQAQGLAAGRAEGSRLAAAVKAALA